MCGIVGYIGTNKCVQDVLLSGLKKLEYRGYDSAGVAYCCDGSFIHKRARGEVKNLEAKLESQISKCEGLQIGIGHTRWATHGKPVSANAHPHTSGEIALVHNGIIENYASLKKELQREGRVFTSETDSEVLVHLIDRAYAKSKKKNLADAVQKALENIEGAYAIAVMHTQHADELILARKSSPLLLGIITDTKKGSKSFEYIIASDASAIVPYTKRVIYLDDGDIVSLSATGAVFTAGSAKEEKEITYTETSVALGTHKHFMQKEMYEQGVVIHNAYRGRIIAKEGRVILGGLSDVLPEILAARRIIIISCGTSYHAGLVGKQLIESFSGIPVAVEYASEFRYRNAPLQIGDVVLAISQSGETADTLAALRYAKDKGALTLGIVNVVDSSIARMTDAGVYNHAGPEISVASTKAFSSQVTVLILLAIMLGRENGTLEKDEAIKLLTEIETIPQMMENFLPIIDMKMKEMAQKYISYTNALYLGRGLQMPLALEGALKIKEIAYIHAEGYASGELKHGVIALIEEQMPSIILAPKDTLYKKSLAVIDEVKARGGRVFAITTEGAEEAQDLADDWVTVPKVSDVFLPLMMMLPLQFFAYHSAILRGLNVDKPRNLAKSVTVE